ncbi:MFS transporter [Labrys monachus]|uniref:MFS family permease n=1 Tax=Labrys monachus TaxID=217067 RepID=A0ABU0FP31_9HYPH|nr:MFS transporter [Labrys monachus]MDQ0396365.1 MFS family permease [Labrys monachus]
MRSSYASIAALLVAVFGVLAGNGVLTTLLPVRAELEHFPALDISLMGSAYFGGMLAGAMLTPRLVHRLGHIKAFGFSSAGGALMITAAGAFVEPHAWIAIGFLRGFCLSGIYAIVESYLQGKAENRVRGRLLGLYSITQYAGWAVGNQFMRLGDVRAFTIFGLAAACVAVFLAPLLLARDDAPMPGAKRAGMRLPWLLRTTPVGFVCAGLIGFANGPFWSLTPVYATKLGMSGIATGTLVTAITIGSAAFQFPVGRISDAFDRRLVLTGLALLTALFEIGVYWAGPRLLGWPFIVVGFIMGGIISTQYYVSSAYTNDLTGRENAVGVAAALLFIYCLGAMLGPVSAYYAMKFLGDSALYLHNAGIHLAMAAFILLRVLRSPGRDRRASPIETVERA